MNHRTQKQKSKNTGKVEGWGLPEKKQQKSPQKKESREEDRGQLRQNHED